MIGTVSRLVAEKGFGFIQTKGSKDYFFHRDDYLGNFNDLVEEFNSGEKIQVEFKDTVTAKGLRAANVQRVDGNESLGDA